jgi:transposase
VEGKFWEVSLQLLAYRWSHRVGKQGIGPSLAVDGSSTKEVFEAYLEHVLLPELEEGQVVVMDSLPAHKPNRVRGLIEERGCELLYLSSYSPDYTTQ